jgi:hypothetical protein
MRHMARETAVSDSEALRRHVGTRLASIGARSLLLVTAPGTALCREWANGLSGIRIHVVSADDLDPDVGDQRRYDAAVVCRVLEHLEAADGRRLLARLRDVVAPWVGVVIDPARAAGWSYGDFIALGFVREASFARDGAIREVHVHHLHDYRPTPDWFGPDHWANPNLWDRHRW